MNEQVVRVDLAKILEKIDKYRKRLEKSFPVNTCEEINRTLSRVDVLRKNISKLHEQQSIIEREHRLIKRKIWFLKRTLSLVIIPAVVSIVIIATYLAFLTILLTIVLKEPEQALSGDATRSTYPSILDFISRSLRGNPTNYIIVALVGGLSIFILVIIAGFAIKRIYSRARIKEVLAEEKSMAEKLRNIRARLEFLQRRLEIDSAQLVKLHETHSCICYNELSDIYSTLETIRNSLISMISVEDQRSVLASILDSLKRLVDKGVYCNSPVTDEFRIEIRLDQDLIKAIEELISDGKINWDEYTSIGIEFRFSTSPFIYKIPILWELRNVIS